MTITSAGYDGSVNEPEWSDLLAYGGGRQYGVGGAGDWKAMVGTADREVRVAAGRGFGYGVRDVSDAEESLTLAPVSSGSRWDLVVARRSWGTNVTGFVVIAGSGTRQLPSRNTTPGSLDDQPVALVKVTAGQSQVSEIVDLRVWGGDGGSFAVDQLALSYLTRIGTVVRVQGGLRFSRCIDSTGNPVWRREDVTEDTGWQPMIRDTGVWTSMDYAEYRRIGAVVYYRITATNPTGLRPGWAVAVFPAGYRPEKSVFALSSHTWTRTEWEIGTDGIVRSVNTVDGNAGVTLHGSFLAAPL